jgi:hypothetical protein
MRPYHHFLWVVMVLCLLGNRGLAADYYPPSQHFGDFRPNVVQGIVGGIPSRSSGNLINVVISHGFSTSASAADNKTALLAGIAAASAGDVVYIPSGTYNINTFSVTNYLKSGITIRGAGMGATILNFYSSGSQYAISMGNAGSWGDSFNPVMTVTGMTADSASITVGNGSLLPSPSTENTYRLARIYLGNEIVTPVVHVRGYPETRKFMVLMTARSGNTVTLAQPLPSGFADGLAVSARIEVALQLAQTLYGMGVEDLTIDCTAGNTASPGSLQTGIFYNQMASSWVKGVKILGHARYGIQTSDCHGTEITGVSIPNGATAHLDACSSYSLVYNNIFTGQSAAALEMEQGSMGTIWAYNYCESLIAYTNHGPHNSYNLFEGNAVGVFESDGFFGGSSDETDFRNWLRYGNIGSFKRFTRHRYVVGNMVGIPGTNYTGDESQHWGTPNISNNDYNGGTWQLSASDYSVDWDSANSRPYQWTGTLSTRTSDTAGVFTLDSGQASSFTTSLDNTRDSDPIRYLSLTTFFQTGGEITVSSVVGNDITFTNYQGGLLPAAGSSRLLHPGAAGFQERDEDVAATVVRKGNYYIWTSNIPTGESLGSDTIPNSYAWAAKPDWFGTLGWPAYSPSSPVASDAAGKVAIPAGYRYINGNEDYLGGAATPQYSPAPGTYGSAQTVTITTGSPAPYTIYYTIDGSTPTTSSLVYSSPVTLPGATTTLKAITVKSGLSDSSIQSGTYTISGGGGGGAASATIQTLNVGTLNIQ